MQGMFERFAQLTIQTIYNEIFVLQNNDTMKYYEDEKIVKRKLLRQNY